MKVTFSTKQFSFFNCKKTLTTSDKSLVVYEINYTLFDAFRTISINFSPISALLIFALLSCQQPKEIKPPVVFTINSITEIC